MTEADDIVQRSLTEVAAKARVNPPTGFDSSIADHDYFVIQDVTDIDKIRDEAYRRQQGDYYAKTESSVIHHHKFNEPCNKDPKKHEVWLRKDQL